MDESVKQSIDARKNAIFAAYKVDEAGTKKIDALFEEIYTFGTSCKDVSDFEAKFATSPLNQKYMDLFTEIAMSTAGGASATAAAGVSETGVAADAVAGAIVTGAAEAVADEALRRVVPTRAAVHQQAYDAARDIPGVGQAINVGEKLSYARHLGRLFGKKKNEEDEKSE